MPDLDQLIATIPRGERGELRIRRCTYRGSAPYVDCRHFYPDDQTGELRPGKGCTLKAGEIADVIAALRKAEGMMEPATGRHEREPRRAPRKPEVKSGDLTSEDRSADMEGF